MNHENQRRDALAYHAEGRPGKIEVATTKPCLTQRDLSLAYTPGVAEPCREIAADPDRVFDYTARGNLVAVVSDGSAVLGLGNIGPLAGKPVMEGKAVLFKRFADIDVFDIEVGTQETDEIIAFCKALEPTVAGINLEDIAAPRCFEIEERLREELSIPVFHDDQHGTALITGAALLNALEIAGKDVGEVRMVVNGAGAAAIACAEYAISLGVKREHVLMCDSKGVLFAGREEGLNRYKRRFVVETERRTLAEAVEGADVFLGVSVGGVLTPEMLRSMADQPIVFALANPDPEITWDDALAAREDVIMATGRSDYPNQVNNVLGFPYIFRGALDVRATTITTEMKHAATRALAQLAHEHVPDVVRRAYGGERLEFGREYLIPKPLDPRLLQRVAVAVARAAIESGVARRRIDLDAYARQLGERLGPGRNLMSRVVQAARRSPRRIAFPEGTEPKVLRAAEAVVREGIAQPVLVGEREVIERGLVERSIEVGGIEILDPADDPEIARYADALGGIALHGRPIGMEAARERVRDPLWFSAVALREGRFDGLVAGVTRRAREVFRPILGVIPLQDGVRRACGLSMLVTHREVLFLADTSMIIEPTAEDLCEITLLASEEVRRFGLEPVAALLSFSSYGGNPHPKAVEVRRAVELIHEAAPDLQVDGEMRADAALDTVVRSSYPQNRLGDRKVNLLVFPDLGAANIALNLVRKLTDASVIGPVTLGLAKPAHVLQPHSAGLDDLVHMTAMAAFQATRAEEAVTA